MFPASKQDIRKSRNENSILQKKVWLYKKKKRKMCNIGANIEYFAFLNSGNITFSQIEIIIKFLKYFVKEDLNFSHMALCEEFSYCKFEILRLLSCVAKTLTKNKNKDYL